MICYIPSQKITLIDINEFFVSLIQTDIINDCCDYGLLKDNQISLNNKDIKKLFIHHLLNKTCNYIVNASSPCVFCLNEDYDIKSEITNYIDNKSLYSFINETFKKFSKIIPIIVIKCNCNIKTLCEDISNNKGEAIDILNNIKQKLLKRNYNFSLQKAKKYTERYNLFFIDKTYFNQLSNKAKILR